METACVNLEQTDAAVDLATETLYRFLAAALSDPRGTTWQLVREPVCQTLAIGAAELLRAEFAEQATVLGFGESPVEDLDLRPAVAALRTAPVEVGNDFLRIFGLVNCRECPPYETEYQPNEDTFFRSQQMADVAGFYRAFGLQPDAHERPDHVSLELEFAAFLLLKKRLAREAGKLDATTDSENAAICQAARANFFRDHISWWAPSFALALRTKAAGGFYESVGRALASLLPVERHRLGIAAPRVPLQANVQEAPEECAGCLASSGA